jgi:hypothetical protein
MAEQTEIAKYNYRDFISSDFLPFRTHLPVGSSAPDCQLILLGKNQSVRLIRLAYLTLLRAGGASA